MREHRKYFLLIILCCQLAWPYTVIQVFAQSLNGTITDEVTGSPIAGVTVWLENTNLSALTDVSGKYIIDGIPVGIYTIIMGNDNYQQKPVSNFAIPGGALPVELSSFTASFHQSNKNIVLNWTTVSETNNLRFEVYRKSINEQSYRKIGWVPGNGTTAVSNEYSFIDSDITNESVFLYKLKQIDYDGAYTWSDEIEVKAVIPDFYSLKQNYPNPFNPTTRISYHLGEHQHVTLKILNIAGQEIVTLVDELQAPGDYVAEWQATNASGIALSSGVYVYQLQAGDFKQTRRMLLIR